ncbi:putative C2H2 transcription factor [Talaromyces proteolyticus]|uniref:C2H2 transcription factor n=1 Tax=Talaromyces proteolyticus TaxID=1131652 RepID=A0AAD4PZ28_9EURO|nr:putative C2H2 transcription factor [Talaromyces proteolyticus]KAH8698576.1 putative C2H2 transcription factor [Talaromyces proteolyticus]
MLLHPTLQDQQLPPNFLYDSQQSFITDDQHQPSLESPFHSPSRVHFSPSSGSTSPTFSSPVFSTTRSPVTTVSGDFPTTFEGSLLEAQPMSVVSSYDPSFHSSSQIAPAPYPATQYSTSSFPTDAPMLAQQGMVANTHSWDSDAANIQLLSPAHAQNGLARRTGFQSVHKRAASGSSGKTGSNSPHAPALRNQHSSSLGSVAENFQNSNKSLPTPVQTPVHNSFLAPAFQNYDPSGQNGDNVVVEQAMRQAVMEQQHPKPQQAAADDEGSFHYSMAPSVSSLSHQNSPVTPQTTYDEFDDGSKAIVHGEDRFLDFDRWMDDYLQFDALPDFNGQGVAAIPVGVPKLNRTISDVYQDELYNTTVMPTPQVRKNPHQQLLTAPYRNLFADRLNAANQGHLSARSQSPVNNAINRERSPFRHGSPLASEFRGSRLQTSSGLGSALQLPNANGMNLQADNAGEVKTISPKDALLEYHEGPDESANGLPSLFPSNDFVSAGNLASRRSSSSTFQPTLPYTQMESFSNQYVTQAANLQQQLNYLQQPQTRHTNDSLIQQTPEFPVSLTTMESTKSESVSLDTKRPEDTSSDSGTYSCTYHGCTLRFESPAKLQKHKREAHRQAVAGQPGAVAREHSTSLALRNSQAGPHRCKQINPSTGKPCNSIFSRPYDLTRHEDTIHNARKQKVRCHLCTEEKTFSRNDALTRHMRVVHPEVDWPGKQRRKGRD